MVIGTTLVLLIILISSISRVVLLGGYSVLEKRDIIQNGERTLRMFDDEPAQLGSVVGDRAPWDDNYEFVEDINQEYIDDNLEYLLAFSCRGRWFCPSSHNKKVVQFGHHLKETVLYPVPHRQYVFSIPKILRKLFLYDRKLLGKLSQCASKSVAKFLKLTLGKKLGIPGIVVAIQTLGDYVRWHPHLHALVADGLFLESGYFFVMPKVDLRPLRELFRAHVLKMLKNEGLIDGSFIRMLMSWQHVSGFNVHHQVRIKPDDEKA